jgi:hypothetical protein
LNSIGISSAAAPIETGAQAEGLVHFVIHYRKAGEGV